MTIRYASDLWPGLTDMLDLADDMRAAGHTDTEIDVFMAELRDLDFERVNAELRTAGHSEEELVEFWTVLMHPGRDDPDSTDIGQED